MERVKLCSVGARIVANGTLVIPPDLNQRRSWFVYAFGNGKAKAAGSISVSFC
jgi:hypothetical protein